MIKKILLNPLWIVILAAALRLIPHPANFTPIGALALFGGAKLNLRQALIFPFLAMIISDIFLGYHSTIFWVYGSFLLITLIGRFIKNKVNFKNFVVASFLSSVLFFVVTNFGVWASTNMYPKTLEGLITCYIMALPFFQGTFLGDLFYNGLFFGAFSLVKMINFNQLNIKR